ncbi:hypothetical protein [Ichthyenterobacterium magnum]|uniref:Methyltransferase family protein n=1 Tax=Ichthyenterobacterium magnum TaxID=1230530 RepID=A0A420DUJ1_9FLAO|nr:hypothetical protein [Ichthyenterobacterium magnum]RKE97981.1 hypothetical protein BXY80_0046 [Ichthyenterobacterium magnum]
MIKKISNKLLYLFEKIKRIIITFINKSTKQSDVDRWSKDKSLFASWDERTQLLANHVQPNSIVFEFGAARLVLKNMLPEGCTYLHSDIVSRNEDTLVVDLNKELPQIPNVDYVIFSGVLEYIFEVEALIKHLSEFTNHFVLSYAVTNHFKEKTDRRFHGWVSDLSEADLFAIAHKFQLKSKIIGTWKKQVLFQFSK